MAPEGGFAPPSGWEDPAFFIGSIPGSVEAYVTILDLLNDALAMIRIRRAGDSLDGDTINDVLFVFNRILDRLNANRRAVFNSTYTDYTLTPNLALHSIGLGGTFNAAIRPVTLDYAALNLGGSPPAFRKITVQTEAWYQRLTVPTLTSSIPTDVYYEAAWPLGSLYFVPIPTVASSVRLWTRAVLSQIADPTSAFSLPPGYQDYLTMKLAKAIAPNFGQTFPRDLDQELRQVEADVMSNNDPDQELVTDVGGLGQSGGTPTSVDLKAGNFRG